MRASGEGQDLQGDVGSVRFVDQLHELFVHRCPVTDQTPDHGLIEDDPELRCTVTGQTGLAFHPDGNLLFDLLAAGVDPGGAVNR
jgi:hypothetical protein